MDSGLTDQITWARPAIWSLGVSRLLRATLFGAVFASGWMALAAAGWAANGVMDWGKAADVAGFLAASAGIIFILFMVGGALTYPAMASADHEGFSDRAHPDIQTARRARWSEFASFRDACHPILRKFRRLDLFRASGAVAYRLPLPAAPNTANRVVALVRDAFSERPLGEQREPRAAAGAQSSPSVEWEVSPMWAATPPRLYLCVLPGLGLAGFAVLNALPHMSNGIPAHSLLAAGIVAVSISWVTIVAYSIVLREWPIWVRATSDNFALCGPLVPRGNPPFLRWSLFHRVVVVRHPLWPRFRYVVLTSESGAKWRLPLPTDRELAGRVLTLIRNGIHGQRPKSGT